MAGTRDGPDAAALEAAVAANPTDAAAQLALATLRLAGGQTEAALAGFSLAGMLHPSAAAAWGEVSALRALERFGAARARLESLAPLLEASAWRRLACEVGHGEALALLRDGQRDAGRAALRRVVECHPDDADSRLNLALVLAAEGGLDEPVALLAEFLERGGAVAPAALARIAGFLAECGAAGPAEDAARRALAADPALADTWVTLGMALHQQLRHGEALDAYSRALALRPRHVAAWCDAGMAHLAMGDLAAGFAAFEWRRATAGGVPPALPAPNQLAGRRVVLTGEQGHGDTLQFVRFAPLLAARGADVVLRVQPALVRLLRGMAGMAGVVAQEGEADGEEDSEVLPLASMPALFSTTLATIPATVPYVTADPGDVAAWRARLAGLPGRKVGLVLAGAEREAISTRAWNTRRSVPLAALAPLGQVAGASFVSLQLGDGTAQPPPGLALFDAGPGLRDFADTAALMEALDLVISVDSAPVHLAGALGRPVWLLAHHDCCWRWLRGRDDSPWYPSLRLFRQAAPGDWAPVVARAAEALARWVRRT